MIIKLHELLVSSVLSFPDKVKSLDLLKINRVDARLIAIKGQYLLFDDNTVFNIRKHTGFKVSIYLY